jgi:dipeptidase E
MVGKIVAIGGGDIAQRETHTIDETIIFLSGNKKPHVLFIPTASSDSPEYVSAFVYYYGEILGCQVDVLYLIDQSLDKHVIAEKIFAADIIYVGGGNTLMMMNVWRKHGIDELLKIAYEKDIVLCGVSAGAICWFRFGNSDSRRFKNPIAPLIKVSALGLVNALLCPHYHSEKYDKDRRTSVQAMMQKTPGVALALDDCCALVLIDGMYQVIASSPGAQAYKLYWARNQFFHEVLEVSNDFKPANEILVK